MATSWAPTTAQVSAVIPARARGTFDATTIPTATQVTELVSQVVTEVTGRAGSFDPSHVINPSSVTAGEDPVTLGDLARWATALGTAAYVEAGFFPEQQDAEDSPAQALDRRFNNAVQRLVDAIERSRGQDKASTLYTGRRDIQSSLDLDWLRYGK